MTDKTSESHLISSASTSAPSWFSAAIADSAESFTTAVRSVEIDCRAWGRRGRPGLVFCHGSAAHLGWWAFLAPFFATDYRVVALSFSGMGASGWRRRYTMDDYADEAMAAATAGGADVAGPPIFVGHSLGGIPVVRIAARFSDRVRAIVTVDSALRKIDRAPVAERTGHRVYADLAAAIARFRLSPPLPEAAAYMSDYLARMGLKPIGDSGWTWRFDHNLARSMDVGDPKADLAGVRTPLAVVRGALSPITDPALTGHIRTLAPPGTIFVDIPEAGHHVMIDQPMALVACLRTLFATWPGQDSSNSFDAEE